VEKNDSYLQEESFGKGGSGGEMTLDIAFREGGVSSKEGGGGNSKAGIVRASCGTVRRKKGDMWGKFFTDSSKG